MLTIYRVFQSPLTPCIIRVIISFQHLLENKGVTSVSQKQFMAQDKLTRSRWNNTRPFRLGKVPLQSYNQHIFVPITKYSPLFDIFYPIILRLQCGDIIEQLAKFYYLDYFEEKEEQTLEPIVIMHIMPGTFGCFIGLGLAFLAFIAETYPMKRKSVTKQLHGGIIKKGTETSFMKI